MRGRTINGRFLHHNGELRVQIRRPQGRGRWSKAIACYNCGFLSPQVRILCLKQSERLVSCWAHDSVYGGSIPPSAREYVRVVEGGGL